MTSRTKYGDHGPRCQPVRAQTVASPSEAVPITIERKAESVDYRLGPDVCRKMTCVISERVPSRIGGPQKPVPGLT